ncbi:MAG: hypothetical protein A3K06_01490 [Candidatus Doudnabacteria bacterium RIFCSPHIGHO2_01_52_17]|uniref:Uncharacterized protein n=1 Tax=Candidatus Doudnabacteria bacterium RIFCSPHIGHO2_01_52_17 TaxID=1817820 RepID=A0A1F5NFJ6_9BACT|nr:MAG: hypothetical protein UY73_C0016G0008 [Parcubacteria group bacterium GW2011_GWA2_52_8]OGE76447.1 MAG: hypothetical protein A3K06_01490 [Candidatus Doudnabacteria bacterium RIFCSPHIGHO2_01_52_17]
MNYVVTLTLSVSLSFLGHHFAESLLKRRRGSLPRLVLRGYRVHHSFFGALAVVIGLAFAGSYPLLATLGYGIGNLWQHKRAHNQENEKGMTLLTRVTE